MYLWKVDSLVEDFKSGKVTQKEEFKYYLLFILTVTCLTAPVFGKSSFNYFDVIALVAMLGITTYGVYYCYKINASGDNRDFIARITCLGLPIIIRLLVILIPIALVWGAIKTFYNPTGLDIKTSGATLFEVVFASIDSAIYYWYLSIKIKAVSPLKTDAKN